MKNKKGFTLIELIAVLVILAIILLISVPIVIGIVKKTQLSANKRSVDYYGKSVEIAFANYLLENGKSPESFDDLKIEYSGKKVICDIKVLENHPTKENTLIYLSKCTVGGIKVKDDKTDDGWYHYGKTTKTFSEEVTENIDYETGDTVTYNGMDFYVIRNSYESDDYVTLLKATSLKKDEVYQYYQDTDLRKKINMDTSEDMSIYYTDTLMVPYYRVAAEYSSYGQTEYINGKSCGTEWVYHRSYTNGCTTNYAKSDIKKILDVWKENFINEEDLKDFSRYNVRLITKEECTKNGIAELMIKDSSGWEYTEFSAKYDWLKSDVDEEYWTMSLYDDSNKNIYAVSSGGGFISKPVYYNAALRPVIELLKSAINGG